MKDERLESLIFHYTATVVVETTCKETGKSTHTIFGTDYRSRRVEPEKRLLVSKILQKVRSEFTEKEK